jgi:adenylosuccinate synthase
MSDLPFGQHVAVVGLSFGDEGKGTMTDYLTSEFDYDLVVKMSGGAQCAHHVTREDGVTHRFAQFGAGTFNGARTHLSEFFMVDPLRLNAEGNALVELGVENPWSLLSVSHRTKITTPFHAAANHVMEIRRGADAHGSCGLGIGETMAYDIEHGGPRVRDCYLYDDIFARLAEMRGIYGKALGDEFLDHELVRRWSVMELAQAYFDFYNNVKVLGPEDTYTLIDDSNVVFEGSQGVLLDEWHGTHPYTTWSTTTFTNAMHLTPKPVFRLGVLRTYTTRHGAGPFPTEAEPTTMPSEAHNGTGRFQGAWRAGPFDAVLARYAVNVCGRVDGLAITHMDVAPLSFCNSYEVDGMAVSDLIVKKPWEHMDLAINERLTANLAKARPVLQAWPDYGWVAETIGELVDVPVAIYGYGPTAQEKRMSDSWGEWKFALSA